MNFTGNIIPASWYRTIVGSDGRPHWIAICLLSEIVYWYRPSEIRDEKSGKVTGYRKKFRSDLLQKSYRELCGKFNISKKQARAALDLLCRIGVVKKDLRNDVISNGAILHNNMYLELVPQKLMELTYPQSIMEVVPSGAPPSAMSDTTLVPMVAQDGTPWVTTSTKNTEQITNREYDYPICVKPDEMDMTEMYRDRIRDNIDYDYLVREDDGRSREQIDEIVELITEIVSIKRETVTIGGEQYPYSLVRDQFLKLNSDHIHYVLNCLKNNNTRIRNIRNYLITSLYNAPNTIDHYYQAEVNHDMCTV